MYSRSIRFILVGLLVGVSGVLAETITGKVVGVADGDTITVLQEETQYKIRFHGIDCPESGQDYGRAAKAFTADHCFGDEVTVVVTDTDRYGRKVGLVLLRDGRVLNHELVAAGLAHWYADYAPADEALKRLQEEAKAAKRGLWSRPDVVLPSDFRRGQGNGDTAPYNPPSTNGALDTSSSPSGGVGGMVYLSATGTKYHRADCRTLGATKKAVSLAEAKKHYGPCGVCKP